MSTILSLFLGATGLALALCVVNERLRFPLMAELGMASISLGMFGGAAAVISAAECSLQALQGIWSLIGLGLLLCLLSWRMRARQARERCHRRSDPQTIDFTALRDIHGGRR